MWRVCRSTRCAAIRKLVSHVCMYVLYIATDNSMYVYIHTNMLAYVCRYDLTAAVVFVYKMFTLPKYIHTYIHIHTYIEALINLGLENRAIAPTLMNSTSSRSHTVLTIYIEQRLPANLSTSRYMPLYVCMYVNELLSL